MVADTIPWEHNKACQRTVPMTMSTSLKPSGFSMLVMCLVCLVALRIQLVHMLHHVYSALLTQRTGLGVHITRDATCGLTGYARPLDARGMQLTRRNVWVRG